MWIVVGFVLAGCAALCSVFTLGLMIEDPWTLLIPLVLALFAVWKYKRGEPRRRASRERLNARFEALHAERMDRQQRYEDFKDALRPTRFSALPNEVHPHPRGR